MIDTSFLILDLASREYFAGLSNGEPAFVLNVREARQWDGKDGAVRRIKEELNEFPTLYQHRVLTVIETYSLLAEGY